VFCQEKPASPASQPQPVDGPTAQEGSKAPPEVEAALRERVTYFYQAHVDGKFRLADRVVAEDSKDAFFEAPKIRYHSFEIIRLNFDSDFQKAEAVVKCIGDWAKMGQKMKVPMVLTTLWKVENGQWFWYTLPPGEVKTPFGTMFKGMNPDQVDAEQKNPKVMIPQDPRAAAAAILQGVKLDKTELMLSSFEKSSSEVKIKNGMGGSIRLRAEIDGIFPGLTFQLDKTEVKGGEEATLTIVSDPKDRTPKPTLTARVHVEETNQVLEVKLLFAVPPEIEKQIPKELRQKNP
jgi:hypothetical protein